ncbi:MAG: hypothetical protein ACJ8ER_07340 [Allosphingosinicella sp.]
MKRLAALFLLVAGCGGPSPSAGERIECALDGAAVFKPSCTVERDRNDPSLLVVRGPDGRFRRLRSDSNGAIETADGAEPAKAELLADDRVEVSVGRDRYRIAGSPQ